MYLLRTKYYDNKAFKSIDFDVHYLIKVLFLIISTHLSTLLRLTSIIEQIRQNFPKNPAGDKEDLRDN